jgi:hypothetical protein
MPIIDIEQAGPTLCSSLVHRKWPLPGRENPCARACGATKAGGRRNRYSQPRFGLTRCIYWTYLRIVGGEDKGEDIGNAISESLDSSLRTLYQRSDRARAARGELWSYSCDHKRTRDRLSCLASNLLCYVILGCNSFRIVQLLPRARNGADEYLY